MMVVVPTLAHCKKRQKPIVSRIIPGDVSLPQALVFMANLIQFHQSASSSVPSLVSGAVLAGASEDNDTAHSPNKSSIYACRFMTGSVIDSDSADSPI
jgi:hypothetical protein